MAETAAGSDGAPEVSTASPRKSAQQLQLEVRLLEALEIYPPSKLQGIHKHFALYGLMEFLEKRLHKQYAAEEILQMIGSFYNLEMLKSDDEEFEQQQEEDFSLPPSLRDESLKDG